MMQQTNDRHWTQIFISCLQVQTDTTGKLLEQLQVKILTWLAFSHLLRGDGTAVLRYVDGICSVQPDAAAQPPLMAIKFKALLISGKREVGGCGLAVIAAQFS